MMDFDRAAERLANDHSKLRQARNRRHNNKGLQISSKAQKEVEYRKRQYELKKQRQALDQRKEEAGRLLLQKCHAQYATNSRFQTQTFSTCTSIHGEGDKIALPPSTLQDLSELFEDTPNNNNNNNNNPMYFRVGILNPNYSFPASHGLKQYIMEHQPQRSSNPKSTAAMMTDNDNDIMEDSDDNDDDDDEKNDRMARIYLEELSHQYYTYTHATVVEFTQEEGCIGLPRSIASALLDPTRLLCHRLPPQVDAMPLIPSIPHTQTVDPAILSSNTPTSSKEEIEIGEEENDMDNNNRTSEKMDVEYSSDNRDPVQEEEGTAGHVAYGSFRVPNLPVEITLLSSLPKGKKCTICPTKQAIQDGFYNLKDVKLVLEQSFIRTRATLTLGDQISTWHRGKKYNVSVTQLEPTSLGVVSCINTDLEVDFATPPNDDPILPSHSNNTNNNNNSNSKGNEDTSVVEKGYRLGGNNHANHESSQETTTSVAIPVTKIELLPEPPISSGNSNICTIQIRSFDGSKEKRRFDLKINTLQHVFDFASNHCGLPSHNFRLVKRFPNQILDCPPPQKK